MTYQVYIKASPEAIWDAITKSEWTQRYGYRSRVEYELRPGGAYRAYATDEMLAMSADEVIIDGAVVEADPHGSSFRRGTRSSTRRSPRKPPRTSRGRSRAPRPASRS